MLLDGECWWEKKDEVEGGFSLIECFVENSKYAWNFCVSFRKQFSNVLDDAADISLVWVSFAHTSNTMLTNTQTA